MTRYSDAALLKGNYTVLLKQPPKEAEWNKASCDNNSEAAAQAIARQIFSFRQSIDPQKEKLEIITFSATGPVRVLGISPIEGDLMRIDGIKPENNAPVSIMQHVGQLSLTFARTAMQSDNPKENPDDDDGLQIGFVIFDELKKRKKQKDAIKHRNTTRKQIAKESR